MNQHVRECAYSHVLVNEKANECMMKVVENILIDKSRICVVNHFCSEWMYDLIFPLEKDESKERKYSSLFAVLM